MSIMQSIYIWIFNNVYKLTGKLSEKIRSVLTFLCVLFLSLFFIAFHSVAFKLFLLDLTKNHYICGVALFLLALFSIKRPLKKVEWDKPLFYTYFLAALGILLISFIHPIGSGYRAFSLLMLIAFPAIYFVWNNRGDYDTLYEHISLAFACAGLLYFGLCLYWCTQGTFIIEEGRSRAQLHDANMFSMIGMVMAISALYMFICNRKSALWFIIAALSEGVGINLVLMGGSRLSVLCVLGSLFAFIVYCIKIRKELRDIIPAVRVIRVCSVGISVIAFSFASMIMLGINDVVIQKNLIEEQLLSQQTMELSIEQRVEPVVAKPLTPSDEEVKKVADSGMLSDVAGRFDTEGMDFNTFTNGRYTIWKAYARHLNLLGNDFDKADWAELTENTVLHAHNNFLEYAYRCGVPVAVLHTLLELIAGIWGIIFLFGKKYRKPYYLFVIMFLVTYAVQSVFDIATLPFERLAPYFFYMSLIPIFYHRENEDGETT